MQISFSIQKGAQKGRIIASIKPPPVKEERSLMPQGAIVLRQLLSLLLLNGVLLLISTAAVD